MYAIFMHFCGFKAGMASCILATPLSIYSRGMALCSYPVTCGLLVVGKMGSIGSIGY